MKNISVVAFKSCFLVYLLVGKINDRVIDEHYYGDKLPNGLDEDFAIALIDKIIECGGNILDKNYYQESIIEIYQGRFYRMILENLKSILRDYMILKYQVHKFNCS